MKVMFRQSEIKRFSINLTSPVMMKGYEGWYNFVVQFLEARKPPCLIDNKLYVICESIPGLYIAFYPPISWLMVIL